MGCHLVPRVDAIRTARLDRSGSWADLRARGDGTGRWRGLGVDVGGPVPSAPQGLLHSHGKGSSGGKMPSYTRLAHARWIATTRSPRCPERVAARGSGGMRCAVDQGTHHAFAPSFCRARPSRSARANAAGWLRKPRCPPGRAITSRPSLLASSTVASCAGSPRDSRPTIGTIRAARLLSTSRSRSTAGY